MITADQIVAIFREYLPPATIVRVVPARQYVDDSLRSSFVQRQIELGIYDATNIYTDFLSPAKVYAPHHMVDICVELFQHQFEGLTEAEAEGLVRWSAAHEARHLQPEPNGEQGLTEAIREARCNAAVAAEHPHLHALMNQVQYRSAVYQRVYARISHRRTGGES